MNDLGKGYDGWQVIDSRRIWLINIVETIEKNNRDIWRLESRSWWG
jgi:hypothetical protein